MFAKIKSIWASILKRITEMTIEQELAAAVAHAEAEFKAIETKIEGFVEPAVAKVEAQAAPVIAQVEAQVQAAAPEIAAIAGSVTDKIVAGIKDLLQIAEKLPADFDKFAALAKAAVSTDTPDAVLVKLKAFLDYAKIDTSAVWNEVLAVVKVL